MAAEIIVIFVDQLLKAKLRRLQLVVFALLGQFVVAMIAATAAAAVVTSSSFAHGLLFLQLLRLLKHLLTVRLSASFGDVIVAP